MQNNQQTKYVHLTYPYDRPGPGHHKDPKLDTDQYRKPFNYAFPSVKSLSTIFWKNITASTISSGGSSYGSILLQTIEGSIVIKGSSNPASEYFSYLLFKELRIRTPSMRVIQHSDEEFKIAIDSVQRATYMDPTLKYKSTHILDRPFLLLMEYIPSQKIYQLGEKRAKMAFDTGYPEGRDRLIRLGILYSVDTLLNIRDRYPLIWGTAGNPENLLISFETNYINTTEELFDKGNFNLKMSSLCAIDNRPLLIGKKTELSNEAYTLYLTEFEKLVKFAFEGLRPVKEGRTNAFDSSTKRFDYASLASTFIYNQTSVDIKTLGEMQILLGLMLGYVNIYHMGMKRVEIMKKKTLNVLKSDWKNLWKDDWDSIQLDIIKEEIKIIEKYVLQNEDMIAWAATITLNNYLITFEKLEENADDNSLILNDDGQTDAIPSSGEFQENDEWLEDKMYEHFGISTKGTYVPVRKNNNSDKNKKDDQPRDKASNNSKNNNKNDINNKHNINANTGDPSPTKEPTNANNKSIVNNAEKDNNNTKQPTDKPNYASDANNDNNLGLALNVLPNQQTDSNKASPSKPKKKWGFW